MSHSFYVTFQGMRNRELDARIDGICARNNAEQGDSGTWMIPPFESEMEFTVGNGGVEGFLTEMGELGLKELTIQDLDEMDFDGEF
jgi:hypothetical protein